MHILRGVSEVTFVTHLCRWFDDNAAALRGRGYDASFERSPAAWDEYRELTSPHELDAAVGDLLVVLERSGLQD